MHPVGIVAAIITSWNFVFIKNRFYGALGSKAEVVAGSLGAPCLKQLVAIVPMAFRGTYEVDLVWHRNG
jgi:hypothetical protein